MKIAYVAGYGRSGSTLLERILAAAPRTIGAGEVRNLLWLDDPEHRCACGERLTECPVWGPVVHAIEPVIQQYGRERLVRAQLASEAFTPRGFVGSDGEANAELLRALYGALGQAADTIIDSSKTDRLSARRPAAMRRAGLDVRVVHLVRDPRGCLASTRKGDNRKLERGEPADIPFVHARTTLSWLLANGAAETLSRRHRVRYEDLVRDAETVLRELGTFLEIDVEPCLEALASGELPPAHQLTGNRMRNQRRVKLRADEAWRERLSWLDRLTVAAVDGGLAWRYGYSLP